METVEVRPARPEECPAVAGLLGLAKVTVQSGTRAIPVYVRSGFAVSPKLLVVEVPAR